MSFREYILYNLQVPPMLLWILSFCIRISHVKVDVAFFMSNINNWHCTLFKFFSLRSRSSALLSIFLCVIQTFIFDQLCWSIFWWNVKTCLSFTFQHATPATLGGGNIFHFMLAAGFIVLLSLWAASSKPHKTYLCKKNSAYWPDDVFPVICLMMCIICICFVRIIHFPTYLAVAFHRHYCSFSGIN